MKKKFALGAFVIAIGLIVASVAILNNHNLGSEGSGTEQSQASDEAEHLPEGMPWEIVSRHFISLY